MGKSALGCILKVGPIAFAWVRHRVEEREMKHCGEMVSCFLGLASVWSSFTGAFDTPPVPQLW